MAKSTQYVRSAFEHAIARSSDPRRLSSAQERDGWLYGRIARCEVVKKVTSGHMMRYVISAFAIFNKTNDALLIKAYLATTWLHGLRRAPLFYTIYLHPLSCFLSIFPAHDLSTTFISCVGILDPSDESLSCKLSSPANCCFLSLSVSFRPFESLHWHNSPNNLPLMHIPNCKGSDNHQHRQTGNSDEPLLILWGVDLLPYNERKPCLQHIRHLIHWTNDNGTFLVVVGTDLMSPSIATC